jgi:hypothetical protein
MTAVPHFDVRDAAHPQRMLVLIGALPMGAILIFVLSFAFGIEGEDLELLGLALVTALVACIPLALDQGRPSSQRQILLSVFSLVYLAHYVTPVFTYYIPAQGPVDAPGMALTQLRPRDLVAGQLVALAGLVSLLIGHYAAGGLSRSGLFPRSTRDWPLPVVLGVAVFMILLGWLIQALAVVGALPRELGSGVLSTLGSALIYGNVLLAYSVVRYRSRIGFLALCLTIPFTSLLGFFTGSKTAVLVTPLMVVLTVIVYRRRIHARWMLLGVLGIALLYPTSVFVRQVILADNTLSAAAALRDPSRTVSRVSVFLGGNRPYEYFVEGLEATGARLDGLGVTSVIVRDTPSRVRFQNGRTLGLFFVAFVPRVLWPEKPEITIGQWITDSYGSGPDIASQTAPTTVGDYYLNFGTPGAIAGMLLLGMILRIIHESLLRGRPTAPGLLAAVVILYHLTLRFEGNVATQYAGMVFAVVPILATHLVLRTFVRAPRSSTGDASGRLATG